MHIFSEGLGATTIFQQLNEAADEKNEHNIARVIAIHNLLEEIITNQSFGG